MLSGPTLITDELIASLLCKDSGKARFATPNFKLTATDVGSILRCRYKSRQCPLNRQNVSSIRCTALGSSREPGRAKTSSRLGCLPGGNPAPTGGGHPHDSPAALRGLRDA